MDNNDSAENSKDALYIVGGLTLIVAGAGLLMAHPDIRRFVKNGVNALLPGMQQQVSNGLANLIPDIQRYMKIRSM